MEFFGLILILPIIELCFVSVRHNIEPYRINQFFKDRLNMIECQVQLVSTDCRQVNHRGAFCLYKQAIDHSK